MDRSGRGPGTLVRLPVRGERLLTKRQLASELGRSTRWVELRMREGLPVLPRRTPGEHARFELGAVRAWLERRAEGAPLSVEERIARLEQEVARLAKFVGKEKA
jgi:phage terminase Nu1 subunit (DNA packaging protein)